MVKVFYNASNTDASEDYLVINKGVHELKRRYIKLSPDAERWYVHDWPNDSDIPIVTKGISAYLSYENRFELSLSLRERIRHGEPYQSSYYFSKYFNICFNYFSRENNCLDEDERKSDQILIAEHLIKEEAYFKDPSKLFTEVNDLESPSIEIINKTALKYLVWVKENKITKDVPHKDLVSKPTIPQIALRYVFEGKPITRINADQIAKENGHTSGDKLYQQYTFYLNPNDRQARPTNSTRTTLGNKIRLFEFVIETLSDINKPRAQSELSILRKLYHADYE